MEPKDRTIVALDTPKLDRAQELADKLAPHVGGFKIGLELMMVMLALIIGAKSEEEAIANARAIRRLFTSIGHGKVFWDGKFYDIPNTIAGAVGAIAAMNFKMFNLHASTGIEGMMAAVAKKGNSLALAVTVLTSFEENDAHLIFGAPTKAKVLQFARDMKLAGFDGIVCSPLELELLGKRKELAGLLKVIPGIRKSDAKPDDQKRTMTAAEAIMAGADYEVIGRPITNELDPVAAAQKIAGEISEALARHQAA